MGAMRKIGWIVLNTLQANILNNFSFFHFPSKWHASRPSPNKRLFLHLQCYRKPSFLPVSYGDRFIPRRYALQPEQMTTSLNLSDSNYDYMDIFELVSSTGSI